MKLIKCTNCGEVFEEAVSPCKICGGVIELTISLTGIGAESSAGTLGSVSETNRNNCKHIKYNAPSGAKSESSLSNSQLTGFVKSPIDIGRQGENRVATCIKNHLTKIGKPYHDAESHDDRGEDCALIIDNENVFIQIVTMKPSDGYWKSVAQGSGDIKLNLNEAASAIKSTISQKALRYQNRVNATSNMLLAIDTCNRYLQ